MWDRMDHNKLTRQADVPVYFSLDSGKASLKYPSTTEQANATLYYDSVDGRVEVSKLSWYFLNPYEIKMDASQYEAGVQFFLQHDEVRVYPQSRLDIAFEHRSGADSTSCDSAAWVTIQRNRNIDVSQSPSHLIHQLRLTISGARNLKDFRIRSLVIKGLHIHGPNANVGGLTNV
jgi:hypothetical protein